MCVQALPLLLSAGGAALQQSGKNRDDRERLRIEADAQRRQDAINARAGERVSQEIQTLDASDPAAEREQANNDFMAALRKAKVADGSLDIGGPAAASDRFTADVGQARAAAGTEGRALAGNLADIDAPMFQRQREGVDRTNAAVDLSLLGGESQGQDFLSQLKRARAGGAGQGLEALGGGLTAFGGAMAGRAVKPKPVSRVARFLPGAP